MRSSEFLPPGDNGDWLADLLTGLEKPTTQPEIGIPQPIIEANQTDFDALSIEDKNGIAVAGHYGNKFYPVKMPMKVQDLDSAAHEMIETVALFAKEGVIDGKSGKVKVSDIAPDFNVRHVNLAVSQGYIYARENHTNSYGNHEAMEFHETMTLYFAILKRISARAIEIEWNRGANFKG